MGTEKVTITVKVDVGLKIASQNKADALGINLSQIATQSFNDFLENDSYTFRSQSAKVAKIIKEARAQAESVTEDPHVAISTRPLYRSRKLFSFYKKGLKKGDTIHFIRDERITAKVINDREVEFEGRRWKLSPLAEELYARIGERNKSGAYQGPAHFTYRGKRLIDLSDIDGQF